LTANLNCPAKILDIGNMQPVEALKNVQSQTHQHLETRFGWRNPIYIQMSWKLVGNFGTPRE